MEISEENFISNFGVHIRKLREQKKMSQQDLANDCSISKSQIARIEVAKINTTLKTVLKIANALNIQPKDLFDFTPKL